MDSINVLKWYYTQAHMKLFNFSWQSLKGLEHEIICLTLPTDRIYCDRIGGGGGDLVPSDSHQLGLQNKLLSSESGHFEVNKVDRNTYHKLCEIC